MNIMLHGFFLVEPEPAVSNCQDMTHSNIFKPQGMFHSKQIHFENTPMQHRLRPLVWPAQETGGWKETDTNPIWVRMFLFFFSKVLGFDPLKPLRPCGTFSLQELPLRQLFESLQLLSWYSGQFPNSQPLWCSLANLTFCSPWILCVSETVTSSCGLYELST